MPKPVQSILIQADTREERSGVPRQLALLPNVEVQVSQLEIGDYILGGSPTRVAERKGSLDFVTSIIDHRLFTQLEALATAEDICPLLILEGDPTQTQSRMNTSAIYGAMTYSASILHIPILPSKSPAQTVQLLHSIARQVQIGYARPGLAPSRKALTLAEQQLLTLMSLPGIGPITAEALLSRFNTLQAVTCASADELATIPGISRERAELLVRILQHTVTTHSTVTSDTKAPKADRN